MAKVKELIPVNRVTWNLKVIPSNSQDIIAKMKRSFQLDEITALVSLVSDILDAYVLTPSGILYQFTVDVKTDNFDKDWWAFALRNYYVVFASGIEKNNVTELVDVELKEVTGKTVQKGKSAGVNSVSLADLLELVEPK